MTMIQKTTWACYLIFGISILSISLGSCQKEVSYALDAEFVFVNESDKTLSFTKFDASHRRTQVTLMPNESDSTIYFASGGYEDPKPNSCCQGILEGVLDGSDRGDIKVVFDGKSCFFEAPANIDNYEGEVIENRFFRHTFTFTNEVLADTLECR